MIEKAIKHLKNTFSKERIYRQKEDIEALKAIIDYYNQTEQAAISKNKLFIKLFINEFLRHTTISGRSSAEALDQIHKLLEITVEEYYHKMRNEIPLLRLQAVSEKIGIIPLFEIKDGVTHFNGGEERDRINKDLIAKHIKVMERALTTEYTEQELKDFLDQNLFKTIIKYSNYD